jgi:hypothetical protein
VLIDDEHIRRVAEHVALILSLAAEEQSSAADQVSCRMFEVGYRPETDGITSADVSRKTANRLRQLARAELFEHGLAEEETEVQGS